MIFVHGNAVTGAKLPYVLGHAQARYLQVFLSFHRMVNIKKKDYCDILPYFHLIIPMNQSNELSRGVRSWTGLVAISVKKIFRQNFVKK